MNSPVERRSHAQIWLLLAVFVAPLGLAFFLYYTGAGRPGGTTNRGELIEPARLLPSIDLPTAADTTLAAAAWQGKWTLVYVGDGSCDASCRETLTWGRQTRLALNADMPRVQRVFLVTGNCCDLEYLRREHPDLAIARIDNEAGARLLAAFPQETPETRAQRLYVVDPLGNLMMRHAASSTMRHAADPTMRPAADSAGRPAAGPPPEAARGLLEDLKRLLDLSHVG